MISIYLPIGKIKRNVLIFSFKFHKSTLSITLSTHSISPQSTFLPTQWGGGRGRTFGDGESLNFAPAYAKLFGDDLRVSAQGGGWLTEGKVGTSFPMSFNSRFSVVNSLSVNELFSQAAKPDDNLLGPFATSDFSPHSREFHTISWVSSTFKDFCSFDRSIAFLRSTTDFLSPYLNRGIARRRAKHPFAFIELLSFILNKGSFDRQTY